MEGNFTPRDIGADHDYPTLCVLPQKEDLWILHCPPNLYIFALGLQFVLRLSVAAVL